MKLNGQKQISALFFFACLLFMSGSVRADPNTLPSFLTNAVTLSQLDWHDDRNVLSLTNGWPPPSKPGAFPNKKMLKETSSIYDDVRFSNSLRRFNVDGRYEVVSVIDSGQSEKDNPDFCESYLAELKTLFGAPSVMADLSGSYNENYASVDLQSQWELGRTRVQYTCLSEKVFQKSILPLVVIAWGDRDDEPSLEASALLRCSRTEKYFGRLSREGTGIGSPITVLIDPNRKRLMSYAQNIGDTVIYNNQEIINKGDGKTTLAKFRLDRVAGTYLWTIRSKIDENSGADIWGQCEKISQAQKF